MQCMLLCRRLRLVKTRRPALFRSWWSSRGFLVEPVRVNSFVLLCVERALGPLQPAIPTGSWPESATLQKALLSRVAARISEFAGAVMPEITGPRDSTAAFQVC